MNGSPDPERGVYGISVAADLTGLGVQTLRLYERRGLLSPSRTEGGTRLYSSDDLDRLRRITDLLDAGLNLAGIALVLQLEAENAELRVQLDDARSNKPSSRPSSKARSGRALRRSSRK
jgi:MerR family transcriptional regulator, heat shock protein HspR